MIINLTPHDVNVYNTTECLVRDGRIYLRDDAIVGCNDFTRV